MNESQIFTDALKLASPSERTAFLDAVCAGNPQMRAAVEDLLRVHDRNPGFLEKPVASYEVTVDMHGTKPTPPPSEAVGSIIAGKYKLIEQIGEGGMGTVWMAQQTEPVKRLVAIKLIKAGMDSHQVIARFETERQVLAIMDHPGIARVLDAGTTETGRPYFVMDLVKGVPITRYCDEHQLTPHQRLDLFVPVCLAIQHAHLKGIIHRDLKPSNVLVAQYDGKPTPKVIDFGVAKATGQSLTDKTLVTGFGNIIGTLEYMSPEQAEMNQLDIDTRSDIYSLGVLLYELLVGSPPFTRKELKKASMLEILRVIREEEPSKPSTKLSTADGLPTLAANRGTEPARLTRLLRGELDWIVMKALEKDRNRRYETANVFAADIQRYLNCEAVLACPPSVMYRFRKFLWRRRMVMFVAACLAALAVTIFIGTWLYWGASKNAEHARRVQEAHEKLPLVQDAIRRDQLEQAFDLLTEIEPLLADHPGLPDLWEQCSQRCSVGTTPAGADVWRRSYDQPGAEWRHVIHSQSKPKEVRVPRGEFLWRATKPGYREVLGLRPPQQTWFTLDPQDAIPSDMIRIPKGQPGRPGMAFSIIFDSVELPDFLIDRHEVTNAQYDQFVKAGGYDRPEYWQDLPFVGPDGKTANWNQVKSLLVDTTGRPGPATWRNGTFLPGEEDHPVRGVNWYEATAYARYAGKSLPTIYHWVQASQIELGVILAGSPYITRSNFGNKVQPVHKLSDPGFHGTYGSMGNVKEWCANSTSEGKRFILGGSCGEPIYTPITLDSSPPLHRDEFFGFRCVKFFNDGQGPAAAWNPAGSIPWPAPPRREDLMDAATFRLVVQDRFTYDRNAPLDVSSELSNEGDWIHVIARINTAYRDVRSRWERMTLHLYLPRNVDTTKGYQAIVYFPALDGMMLPRMRPIQDEYGLDALVRSGRAVLRPVYDGMYERRHADFPSAGAEWEVWRTHLGLDLMRSLDYLQQRGDINMQQVGYYGFSFGAEFAGSLVAVEPRFRAAVFEAGGLGIDPLRKERAFLEWRHNLPRITIPVLMLNGQVDPIYPVKETQEPMFNLLGSPIKEHYVHLNGHHMLPPDVKFSKALQWYDKHLGKPLLNR